MGRAGIALLAAGGLLEICYIGMLALGNLGQRVPIFFALFGTASVLYLWAVHQDRCARLRTVVAFGLLFRATLLPAAPTLSDDIYRYVWDGRVQAAGINPYRYPPDASALAHLRDEAVYPGINHPHIPTVYPPLAQAIFLICHIVWPGLWGVKAALVGFDLLTAWALLGLMRRRGLPSGGLLVYLWNPLLVVEVAGQGHVDILGVAFLAAALLSLETGRHRRAIAALGLSFLGKFFAVCLLPVFWRQARAGGYGGDRERRPAGMLKGRNTWPFFAFAGLALLGYLPYVGAGAGLFAALGNYARHWEFNSLVFGVLRTVFRSGAAARMAIGLAFGGTAVALALRGTPPLRAGYLLAGLFIWLTPTLHPWYAIWILPFLVFYRRPAWLTFTCLVALSYQVLIRYSAEGVWEDTWWVRAAEFGGFAAVWMGERMRQYAARGWKDGAPGPGAILPGFPFRNLPRAQRRGPPAADAPGQNGSERPP